MLVPSGVTPPPIISAIDPVTTTLGKSVSSVPCATLQSVFSSVLAEFVLAQTCHGDRQLVRRKRIGVMQHGGDRQVLAADGPVDDHLQPFDRREDIDRSPVTARTIVIENQHQTGSSAVLFCAAAAWPRRLCFSLKSGRSSGRSCQMPDA